MVVNNTTNNIMFQSDVIVSKYMAFFDTSRQPSEYRFNFNADINFFDKLEFPYDNSRKDDHGIIIPKSGVKYKQSYHKERDNTSRNSLYEKKLKSDDFSSNSLLVIFENVLIYYYYNSYSDDQIMDIDDNQVSTCTLVCLYDGLELDLDKVRKICKDTLINVKMYPADIFLQSEISLLVADKSGIDTVEYKVKKPEIDFSLNYSPEFIDIHNKILNQLKLKKGLFVFDGDPGSGKTMYIRYLMDYVCTELRKKVIYIPGEYISSLSGPEFTLFLSDNKNSILVIEDGDTHIQSRELNRRSSVSNILNLSDGFLNDCFDIQVILTYNIPTQQVDPALLRTGRLLTKYHFGKITSDQATSLSSKLGINKIYTEDTILAQVYSDGCDKSTIIDIPAEHQAVGFKIPKINKLQKHTDNLFRLKENH
jgi:hypothetical protein